MDPLNQVSSTMTLAQLQTLLDPVYAFASHVHSAADITSGTVAPARLGSGSSITTKFLRGDSTWQTITVASSWGSITGTLSSQADLQAALDAKLSLAGGTMTGTLTLVGGAFWDSPGAGYTRLFTSGAGGIQFQANAGLVQMTATGTECLDVYPTGYVTIQNAATNTTNPSLEIIERGTQTAPLLKAGTFTVAKNGEPKHPIYSGSADPTTSNFATGLGGWWKNTTSGEIRWWYNDGGTMKKSAALT